MFGRLFFVLSMLGMLFGQVPASVTICSCTGEVADAAVAAQSVCAKHLLPKCDHCKPKPGKGCFVTKACSHQMSAVVPHVARPELAAVLLPAFIVIEASWQPTLQSHPCLNLPRIREPDLRGHQLRAPPSLA